MTVPDASLAVGRLGRLAALAMPYLAALAPAATAPAVPAPAAAPGDRGGDFNITFPDAFLVQNGGPVLDIKRPPDPKMHTAVGDGKADDTAAFLDAWDLLKERYQARGWNTESLHVHLPSGTYLVKDTLIYRGATLGAAPRWTGNKFDINKIHFIGQRRSDTVIRLADRCPGYQDPARPKIVLAFQHPDTVFNNIPGSNWLRNLTIDTGAGNPGAIALYFQGANQTDLRNLTIRSGDGAGKYGLWFKIGSIQGYYADITIDGFDYGIADPVNAEGDVALEYLTLRRQRVAGILLTGGGIQIPCSGGTLWIFGFKTENGKAQAFNVKGGGHLEVLGGYASRRRVFEQSGRCAIGTDLQEKARPLSCFSATSFAPRRSRRSAGCRASLQGSRRRTPPHPFRSRRGASGRRRRRSRLPLAPRSRRRSSP